MWDAVWDVVSRDRANWWQGSFTELHEEKKTITFFFMFFLRKVYSSSKRRLLSQTMYPCSSVATVDTDDAACAATNVGFFWMARRARSTTLVVCVAEKRAVWRPAFGRQRTIAFMSSSKPISRMRSASSIANTCSLSK